MKLKFDIGGESFSCDTLNPLDISIPLKFNGDQPNTYDVDKASSKAFEAGEFIGDTRRGGGCNFEEYKLITHCNGTHTECVGHISFERISIHDTLKESFFASSLITVVPERAFETREKYIPDKNENDLLITEKILQEKLEKIDKNFLEGLIIRTLPNDESKKSRRYRNNNPPFFSVDAMNYLVSLNVNHLLIDVPSVDRTFDEGKLTAHHVFWKVPYGSHDIDPKDYSLKTITEMIYVPNDIEDGKYLMSIQIPNFIADAAPSRVMLFKVKSL